MLSFDNFYRIDKIIIQVPSVDIGWIYRFENRIYLNKSLGKHTFLFENVPGPIFYNYGENYITYYYDWSISVGDYVCLLDVNHGPINEESIWNLLSSTKDLKLINRLTMLLNEI